MAIPRRSLGLLGLSALMASARAQPARQGAGPPCAVRPGEIVGLLLEGPAPAGTVAVFGQAFRPGDLPRDATLAARSLDGRALPVQADVVTRHADGSTRFAVVSISYPGGQRAGAVLARQQGAATAPPINLAEALAGRGAVVELLPADGGMPWQADLAALAATAPAHMAWQRGGLAAQTRLMLPLPPAAVGGARAARLVADVAMRADGVLWVAAWVRNDGAMQPDGGAAHYAMRLLLDGREVLATEPFRQAQYQAFGRSRAVGRDGEAAPLVRMRHDVGYLAETGAVARYDLGLVVDPGLLGRLGSDVATPAWHVPLAPRAIAQYMPSGGGRGDLGPATLWQVAWLVSGDQRAADYAMGQAEAAGAVPWHFWDASNGTWLNTDHYPRLWTDPRGGTGRPGDAASTGLTQQRADTGWAPDLAHQPDLSTVPFLLTGERWILDNLQAQTSATVMATYPAERLDGHGLVVNGGQVRASAWALRQVGNAAWLSREGSAEQRYFHTVEARNWAWLVGNIPEWTRRQGEAHGWVPGTYGGRGALAPWQQDYFASTTTAAAKRGNADAVRFLRWQANFLLGRFTSAEKGFPPHLGTSYGLMVAEPTSHLPTQATIYTSWARIAAENEPPGQTRARPWADGNYNQLALATMAGIADALDSREAAAVFQSLVGLSLPGTAAIDYQRCPTFAIVPRGFSRGRAVGCELEPRPPSR
ncbi:hypothetical protein [Falsiroseomonas sp.]|uniref:hypothetical protein n=1 Tax=Falsiroseomonas sp. TaxID=2870721 RepID=UPI00356A636F